MRYSFSDPTSCGGNDGSLTISGLNGSTSYNISYDDISGTIGPNTLTSDVSGNIIISGLSAGNYQNIIVELIGCSTIDNGQYSLSDPIIPNAPIAGTDMTYCEGDVLADMTASGGSGIYTYLWDDQNNQTSAQDIITREQAMLLPRVILCRTVMPNRKINNTDCD